MSRIISREIRDAIRADLPSEVRAMMARRAREVHHYDSYYAGGPEGDNSVPWPDVAPYETHLMHAENELIQEVIYRIETYDQTAPVEYDANWSEFVIPDLIGIESFLPEIVQAIAQHHTFVLSYKK